MLFIFFIGFVAINFVWPCAEQTVFPPWWGYFDTFRFISDAPACCCMIFRQVITSTQLNKIHHHYSHYVLNFYPHSAYAAFDCHRFRIFYGEVAYILLWRPGVSRVLWTFQRLKAVVGA